MVSLETAESALKTLYLGVVSEQLNINANPLLAKIEQTSNDVWGKEVVKLAPYGVNGGVGAGDETGNLPKANGNNYAQFKLDLKNLYGTIEISDKAMLASDNSAGAFINLLNSEMEGLLKASKFNFSRMLYGDGSGLLATAASPSLGAADEEGTEILYDTVYFDSVKNLMEGMTVDFYSGGSSSTYKFTKRITAVDRAKKGVKFDVDVSMLVDFYELYIQNSKDKEITGLKKIFSDSESLYGVMRSNNFWLNPYVNSEANNTMSITLIQSAIDNIEQNVGGEIDFITCSYDVRRFYLNYLNTNRRNIDYMNLDGGFKAISYNGVPVIADRFIDDGVMYLLNSSDFKLHQLCDWRWIEGENGKIIRQNGNSPTYTATLVKYADPMCDRPAGQAMIKNIKS